MGSGLLLAVSPLNDNWNSEDTQFQPKNAPDKPVIFMLSVFERGCNMFCPNCGCMTLGNDCEWCGPVSLHTGKEKYCEDCGGVKSTDNKALETDGQKDGHRSA